MNARWNWNSVLISGMNWIAIRIGLNFSSLIISIGFRSCYLGGFWRTSIGFSLKHSFDILIRELLELKFYDSPKKLIIDAKRWFSSVSIYNFGGSQLYFLIDQNCNWSITVTIDHHCDSKRSLTAIIGHFRSCSVIIDNLRLFTI